MPSITDIPSHIDIVSNKTNKRQENNKLSTSSGTVTQTNSKFVIEVLLATLHEDTSDISSQPQQVTQVIESNVIPTIEEIIKSNTLDMKQSVAFEIMFCSFLLRSLETETIETGLIHDLSNNVGNENNMDGHSNLFNLKKELAKRGGKIN